MGIGTYSNRNSIYFSGKVVRMMFWNTSPTEKKMKWHVKTETTRIEIYKYLIEAKSRREAMQLALQGRGQVIDGYLPLPKTELIGCEKIE